MSLSETQTNSFPPAHQIFVVQQPEVHLHAAAQARLADLFVGVVNEGHQTIVETHSEHLVFAVQNLVAEGEIDANDVQILFVRKAKSGSNVLEIALKENGSFDVTDPIEGFFDVGLMLAERYSAAVRKRGR